MNALDFMKAVNQKISQRIREHAEANQISYDEAAKHSYLVIDGKIIQPIDAREAAIFFDPNRNKDKK